MAAINFVNAMFDFAQNISLGSLFNILPAIALVVISQVLAEVILWFVIHVIKPLTEKTETTLDDYLVDCLPTPLRLGGFALGIFLFASTVWPNATPLGRDWIFIGEILSIAWTGFLLGNVANALVAWYYSELSHRIAARHGAESLKLSKESFPMFQRVVRYAVYISTLIIILHSFGIEVTPLLTGLGIAGLAVAVALQDTLSNFFSGLHLLTDKPIKNGEFISLDSEEGVLKGFVEEIGWRSTRIRTRGNLTYIIPNNKLASSVVVNFSRGAEDNWKGSSLTVGVSYDSDPDKVKRLIVEAIRQVQKADPRLGGREPSARLEEFGDSALVYRAFWAVKNYSENEAVAGEVREAILKSFRKNGIEIPFPVRTVYMHGPGANKRAK
jgi:small-conductance mechanosensitive channel